MGQSTQHVSLDSLRPRPRSRIRHSVGRFPDRRTVNRRRVELSQGTSNRTSTWVHCTVHAQRDERRSSMERRVLVMKPSIDIDPTREQLRVRFQSEDSRDSEESIQKRLDATWDALSDEQRQKCHDLAREVRKSNECLGRNETLWCPACDGDDGTAASMSVKCKCKRNA